MLGGIGLTMNCMPHIHNHSQLNTFNNHHLSVPNMACSLLRDYPAWGFICGPDLWELQIPAFHPFTLIAWLADGDSLMCYIFTIGRLIARMFSTFSLWGCLFIMPHSAECMLYIPDCLLNGCIDGVTAMDWCHMGNSLWNKRSSFQSSTLLFLHAVNFMLYGIAGWPVA